MKALKLTEDIKIYGGNAGDLANLDGQELTDAIKAASIIVFPKDTIFYYSTFKNDKGEHYLYKSQTTDDDIHKLCMNIGLGGTNIYDHVRIWNMQLSYTEGFLTGKRELLIQTSVSIDIKQTAEYQYFHDSLIHESQDLTQKINYMSNQKTKIAEYISGFTSLNNDSSI